jgi:hypothetical protein
VRALRDASPLGVTSIPAAPAKGCGVAVTEVVTFQVILQGISALALTASLVYAALQLRNWRTAQYVANFTKLVELQLELRKMRVDDPQLALADPDVVPAGTQEEVRAYFYDLMQLSLFEIAWFSHEHGQLPDDYFRSWVSSMSAVATRPTFQAMWRSSSTKIMHDRFREYVEVLVAGIELAQPAERVDAHGTSVGDAGSA